MTNADDAAVQVRLGRDQAVAISGLCHVQVVHGAATVFGHDLVPGRGPILLLTEPHQRYVLLATVDDTILQFVDKERRFELSSVYDSCAIEIESAVLVPVEWRRLAAAIVSNRDDPVTVLVRGPLSAGKSTLCRFLVNVLLETSDSVTYLDCDPGQAEFTAPGHVASVVITAPLLSPPFAHLGSEFRIDSCVHIGDVSPVNNVAHYLGAVAAVVASHSPAPLVVNTMGWVEGIGGDLLAEILDIVRPAHIVDIVDATMKPLPMPRYRPVNMHQVECCSKMMAPSMTAGDRRILSLAAAFISNPVDLIDASSIGARIASAPCYRIAFADIHVRYVDEECEGGIGALNGVFVGLCYARDPTDPYPPCLGLGLIRAIDTDARVFYITTRVAADRLAQVTCLMRGRLATPSVLMFQDPDRTWFPAPYAESDPLSKAIGSLPIKGRRNVRR